MDISRSFIALAATVVLVLSPLGAQQQTITIDGSTTVGPIAEAFAEDFMKANPGIAITVKKTGSGDGAAALVDGRADIAAMSRFMKAEEFKKAVENGRMPVAHVVAMDGVAVVVHPSNPVVNLTRKQISDIYTGKATNWKQLGGADMAIVPITRDSSSGTFEAFMELVVGKGNKLAGNVETVNANPAMQARVSTTTGAIGYVGLGFLENVKALQVEGVMPTRQTVSSGKYPVSRPLFLFTNGYPELGSPIHAYVTWHLSERGQEIVEAKHFVPVTNY